MPHVASRSESTLKNATAEAEIGAPHRALPVLTSQTTWTHSQQIYVQASVALWLMEIYSDACWVFIQRGGLVLTSESSSGPPTEDRREPHGEKDKARTFPCHMHSTCVRRRTYETTQHEQLPRKV